jgi:solute carrier family 10 (sodium/bile acid cotransporter), member 7
MQSGGLVQIRVSPGIYNVLSTMRSFLAQRWFLCALAAGLTITLLVPGAIHSVTQHLVPHVVIALALFLMAWTMPSRSLAGELRAPTAALWAILLGYTATPALAWLLGHLAPTPDLRIGLLISASVPCTLASCIVWTRLAGGNEATALLALLGSTLMSWLCTTFWLTLTTGAEVELDTPRMMSDLVVTLVIPVALGQGLRAWPRLTSWVDRRRTALSNFAQLFVLSIILKTTATLGLKLHDGSANLDAGSILGAIALTQGVHLSAFAVGWWTAPLLGLDRGRRIAVAFASSQKTLPVALFLFENYFADVFPLAVAPLLFYHVGQLLVDTPIAERLKRSRSLTIQ